MANARPVGRMLPNTETQGQVIHLVRCQKCDVKFDKNAVGECPRCKTGKRGQKAVEVVPAVEPEKTAEISGN